MDTLLPLLTIFMLAVFVGVEGVIVAGAGVGGVTDAVGVGV